MTLVRGDAMHLPYEANAFDIATIGFGLRNVPDANQVLAEMARVVHPNGQVASLETSQPTSPVIKFGWQIYFKLVPIMAKFAVNKYREYAICNEQPRNLCQPNSWPKCFAKPG